MKEAAILRDLTLGDPKNQGHIVRFLDDFRLGEHVCVVMEAMHMNLRKLLKTYGASQGLAVKAVLSYTQQVGETFPLSLQMRLCPLISSPSLTAPRGPSLPRAKRHHPRRPQAR